MNQWIIKADATGFSLWHRNQYAGHVRTLAKAKQLTNNAPVWR